MRLLLEIIAISNMFGSKLYNAYMKYIAYAGGITTVLLLYRTGSRSCADLNGM